MSAERVLNFVTPEEYLALDRAAEERSEYFAGEMVAMSGASDPHELIVINLGSELKTKLRGTNCAPRGSGIRVLVNASNYLYPDVTVTCGERQFTELQYLDTLINPTAVFEILSDSTENRDRGLKWRLYKLIESLQHYILIDQHAPRVEAYTRRPDGDWLLHTEESLDGVIRLSALGIDLPMSAIYEDFASAYRRSAG